MSEPSQPGLLRYHVRPSRDHGDCGGIFVIGTDGYFSCVTDWGNYAFQWRSIGVSDFREFLVGIGTDYLLGKIADEAYDGDKSCARIKETILELRRRGGKDKEWALKEMEWLDSCSRVENEFWFGCWYMKTEVPDAGECRCTSYDGQTRGFADKLWPRFVSMLKTDIAESQRAYALARAQAVD